MPAFVSSFYTPIAPSDQDEILCFDFGPILYSGETITAGSTVAMTNTNPPGTTTSLIVNSTTVQGTELKASVTASGTGSGQQLLTFTAVTTQRPSLSRSALIYVAPTS